MDQAKKRRLASLGRTANVAPPVLAKLLEDIGDDIPSHCSRAAILRARQFAVDSIVTPYGPVLQHRTLATTSGTDFKCPILDPKAMLHHLCSACPAFASSVQSASNRRPPSAIRPGRIALYSDEVVPGNVLSHDNKRKMQVIYWSFIEMGGARLASEDFWMTLTVIRSSVVNDMVGGMSYVFRMLLQAFFDPSSHDFRTGVSIRIGGLASVMFAGLGMIVSDESALRQTWLCKGAGGTRLCMGCKNVVAHDSGLVENDRSGYLVPSTCSEFAKLDLHTDETIREIIDKLAANVGVMTKAQFAKLEQELGFNYCTNGVLCSPEMRTIARPISTNVWDWAHVYLVSGLLGLEFGLLISALRPHGLNYNNFHDYLQLWTWPHRLSSRSATGKDCCSNKRSASSLRAGVFKHTASEGLSVYPILCHYVEKAILPTNLEVLACHSFMQLCLVLDMLIMVPRGVVPPAALQAEIERHLQMFKRAHGEEEMIPKHHMSLHLGHMLAMHGTLVNCLTHERKHRMVKRYSANRCNLANFEAGMLGEILSAHLEALSSDAVCPHGGLFVNPRPAGKKVAEAMQLQFPAASIGCVSNEAFVSEFQSCARKDVVAFLYEGSHRVGEVWFHCKIDGVAMTCISGWQPETMVKMKICKNPTFVPTTQIEEVLLYSKTGDIATLILPPKWR